MKSSKFEEGVLAKADFRELTHREWYWWALSFQRSYSMVATATIFHSKKCGCCKHIHTVETVVKIHGPHEYAVYVARALIFLGRPGIKPEDINEIEVKSADCTMNRITRGDNGWPEVGIALNAGTIDELVDVGVLRRAGGQPAA